MKCDELRTPMFFAGGQVSEISLKALITGEAGFIASHLSGNSLAGSTK